MKHIVLLSIFLALGIQAKAQEQLGAKLILVSPKAGNYSVSVLPWQNGYQKTALQQAERQGDSLVYEVYVEYLPCQLTVQIKPWEANARVMSFTVFITDENLNVEIKDWKSKPNWHGDKENMVNENFMDKSTVEKQQLGILQTFLVNYSVKDKLAKQATKTYKQKQEGYNQWVNKQIKANSNLFVSRTWKSHLVNGAEISKDKEQNIRQIIDHSFDFEDFTDTTLLRTDYFLNLLNNYMSMNEMLVQATKGNREDLMTEAGRQIAEKASLGHPRLYGWVVDYLYTNYERYAIHAGITMLIEHIDNPNCLTYKKIEIKRRLDGMQRLAVGNKAPDLTVKNSKGDRVNLTVNDDQLSLLFFYESNCPHCEELLGQFKKLSKSTDLAKDITISTIALDESLEIWKTYSQKQQFVWNDYYVEGGINGKVAKDFCLLSSPSMFVIGKGRIIESTPKNIIELLELFYDEKTIKDYLNVIQN